MQNLMLGKDGQLWVVDWADAGFYPEWFEGANMKQFFIEQGNSGSWNRLCSWIFGDYESRGQYSYIDSIRYSLVALKNEVVDMVRQSLLWHLTHQSNSCHRSAWKSTSL